MNLPSAKEILANSMKKKNIILGLTVLWAGLIFLGSSIPGSSIPSAPDITSFVVHLFEYTVLGILLGLYVHMLKKYWHKNAILTALGVGFLYALSDETHQLFVPGRNFEAFDLLMDLIGLVTGLFVIALHVHHIYSRLVKEPEN